MSIILIALQLTVAFGLLNVWLLRYKKETKWRGGSAQNMTEEFENYGLPKWFMFLVGFLKISIATLLIIGIWLPLLVKPSAAILTVLMLGAVSMHLKVKDPVSKALPAIFMLVLAILITLLS